MTSNNGTANPVDLATTTTPDFSSAHPINYVDHSTVSTSSSSTRRSSSTSTSTPQSSNTPTPSTSTNFSPSPRLNTAERLKNFKFPALPQSQDSLSETSTPTWSPRPIIHNPPPAELTLIRAMGRSRLISHRTALRQSLDIKETLRPGELRAKALREGNKEWKRQRKIMKKFRARRAEEERVRQEEQAKARQEQERVEILKEAARKFEEGKKRVDDEGVYRVERFCGWVEEQKQLTVERARKVQAYGMKWGRKEVAQVFSGDMEDAGKELHWAFVAGGWY